MFGVDAALIAETTGLRVRIDGKGNVLTCRLEGNVLMFASALLRGGAIVRTMRTVVPLLLRFGLRMEIFAGKRPVGRMGSGVRQNAVARLLSLPATTLGR